AVNDPFYDTAVASLIGMQTTDGKTFDNPNDQTVVTFIIPAATHEPVGNSYHAETQVLIPASGGGRILVPYIVLDQLSVGFVTDFNSLMWSISHELGESATDPHPYSDPGWFNTDIETQGEVADLCNNIPALLTVGGNPVTVNRFYSTK